MKRCTFIVTIVAISIASYAQSIERQIVSAGGLSVENASAMISYTIGEPIVATGVGPSATITQGFQQVDSNELLGLPLRYRGVALSVYPNPARSVLNVRCDGLQALGISPLYIQLFDLNGKLIEESRMLSDRTQIDVSMLRSSVYTVKLVGEEQAVLQRLRFIKY